MPIAPEPQRFYDPGLGPGSPVTVKLRRAPQRRPERWFLEDRIAYRDRRLEAAGLPDILVPRDPSTFTTDLTSVPQLFTWLVSRTGTHLPAALIHDAMTPPFSATDAGGDPLPDWTGPSDVTRLEADRIFRDAMADLGTPPIRRWLIWSAVSLPTAWQVDRLRAGLGYLGLAAIVVIGWFATLDLFDQGRWLPWMGDHPWTRELLLGAAMAVVVPVVLAGLWPAGIRRAGAIAGVAVAGLLHVTAAVGLVTFCYQVAEFRHRVWAPPRTALKIALTLVALAVAAMTAVMVQRY